MVLSIQFFFSSNVLYPFFNFPYVLHAVLGSHLSDALDKNSIYIFFICYMSCMQKHVILMDLIILIIFGED